MPRIKSNELKEARYWVLWDPDSVSGVIVHGLDGRGHGHKEPLPNGFYC